MSAVCREIRSTTVSWIVRSLRKDKTVADELFVEGRESDNGPLRLKTYLGARSSNAIRLFDPPWRRAQADPVDEICLASINVANGDRCELS